MRKGFTFLDEAVPGIRWDSKYATWDNMTGKPMEGYEVNRIIVSEELGKALLKAREEAAAFGYGLLVWDGYRPQRASDELVEWLTDAKNEQGKDAYYPKLSHMELLTKGYVHKRSAHSRGCAVDLALYLLETWDLVPMGTNYEFMDERSVHGAEGLTATELKNRELLRYIMEQSGFMACGAKWWHYELKKEPYPNRYFNFPIKE